MSRTRWVSRWDILPVALCLLVAAVLGVWSFCAASAQTLRVTTPTGEAVYSLSQEREISVCGRDGLTVVISIENGAAFVKTADCPDHVCVKTGRLSRGGQTAVCLPAGVMLTVEGDRQAPDAVAR